ncbi:MAG: glycosyltransferase family 2 protein [Candidatus Sungbacteria bacterium]|uniref:Glycosyltransferase family 2 protein n=1 Tax=Candidatus Sungiibacteriota bacterium TaxID=2750080 RepID=A0A9D6LT29_9BACT|nr:glycosyltransferase family 2 protein [Candidatus Sungbacteria bacterium]
MDKIPVSVFILTKNSEATLGRALLSVKDFDDVIVSDGGSVDGTVEIARRHNASIFLQHEACLKNGSVTDFSCLRNDCLSHAKYDWVLYVDSDESISQGLAAEIKDVVSKNPSHTAFQVPGQIILDGKPIRFSSNYPAYQIRFFRKSKGRFEKPIHERFRVASGSIGTLQNPWHYYVASRSSEEDYRRDLARDMPIYQSRYGGHSVGGKGRGLFLALRTILVIIIKSIRNYMLHGLGDSYPPKLEIRRIRYQFAIIKAILHA